MNYFRADTLLKNFAARLKQLKPDKAQWSDKYASATFAELINSFCRYDATAKSWRIYNGCVWQLDVGDLWVRRFAKYFSDALIAYGSNIGDEKQRLTYLEWAIRYTQYRYRETLIKDARDEKFLTADDLNKNDDLLNCLNGTMNLETLEFRPHRAADLLTKVARVEYDPDARSELWERSVAEIMCNDAGLIRYLQKLFGYALTAGTELETCWMFFGASTRNGKSTILETIGSMLGDYGAAIQPETLAQRQNRDSRNASGDVARLAGVRFVNCSEPPKRMLLDAALLKQLLGRDTITARHLYEREFQFIPKFKIVVNTNFLPMVTDDTLFASGRVNVVPFNRHFEPDEQDKTLKTRLQSPENLSGILNWCLEGLRLYRQEGLEPPRAVRDATAVYRKNSDKIGRFIDECLVYSGKNSPAGSIYAYYAAWCNENGYGCENKGNFFDDIRNKGLFAPSGTVDGRTVRNIVKGYELSI